MQKKVSFDSDLTKFGIGLFKTIKVIQGRAVFLDDHLDRLYNSINELGLLISIERQKLRNQIINYVKNIKYKAIRITVFDKGYNFSLRDIKYQEKDYKKGYRLKIAPIKRGKSFLYKHKTTNCFENIYIRKKAIALGYDDALIINTENKILESSMANVFFIKGESVYTPSLESGILPGIIRRRIIEIIKKIGLEIVIKDISLENLTKFQFSFMTNSLIDLIRITSIEDTNYSQENEIFKVINDRFKKMMS